MLYSLCKYLLIGPVLRQRLSISVTGADHIPRFGPVIIASNHLAEVDSLVLPLTSARRLSFFAKAEYFTGSGLRGLGSRAFFRGTGQIPVDRAGDDSALDAATAVLERGEAWAIYPEGTRSPDGRLYRGHTGMMRVAERVPGTVVVPALICGTREVNPPGPRRLDRGSVHVAFGKPLATEGLLGSGGDVRVATDAVMTAIAALGDIDYVDEYSRTHN